VPLLVTGRVAVIVEVVVALVRDRETLPWVKVV
jgi:hypothetical protein